MKRALISVSILAIALVSAFFLTEKPRSYLHAESLLASKCYSEAYEAFSALGDYRDSSIKLDECRYQEAAAFYDLHDYDSAAEHFHSLGDYRDSMEMYCSSVISLGAQYLANEEYTQCIDCLLPYREIEGVSPVIGEAYYKLANTLAPIEAIEAYQEAISFGCVSDCNTPLNQAFYEYASTLFSNGEYDLAFQYFDSMTLPQATFGTPYFKDIDSAREYIVTSALSAPDGIRMYVLDPGSSVQSIAMLPRLAQADRGSTSYDKDTHELVISPSVYPGIEIYATYLNGSTGMLPEEFASTLSAALQIVSDAKTHCPSSYELLRYLHDYICRHISYDNDSSVALDSNEYMNRTYTCIGGLLDGRANCQGYSDTFYLLASLAGFQVRYQAGYGNGSGHMWNLICLDGQWYNIDVTFDDQDDRFFLDVIYEYFLFIEDSNHSIENRIPAAVISEENDPRYDYFIQEGFAFPDVLSAVDYAISVRSSGEPFAMLRIDTPCDYSDVYDCICSQLAGISENVSWSQWVKCEEGRSFLFVNWAA